MKKHLFKFINNDKNFIDKNFIPIVIYLFTIILTFDYKFAKNFTKVFKNKNRKSSYRKFIWLLRHSWLNFTMIEDEFYIFSEDLNLEEIEYFENYLNKIKLKIDEKAYLTNLQILLARKIHLSIETNQNQQFLLEEHPAYQDIINFEKNKKILLDLPIEVEQKYNNIKKSSVEFSKIDAIEALKDFERLFPIDIYNWYIISGTFLGYYRENGFLSHDYDMDFGINYDEINFEEFINIINNMTKFTLKKIDYGEIVSRIDNKLIIEKKPFLVKILHDTGIDIDIFIHYIDGKNRWHASNFQTWNNTEFGLKEGIFEGVNIKYPDNEERYLTENYGDWKTPKKEFNCTIGTPNLSITKNYFAQALFLKRVHFHKDKDINYNYELKDILLKNKVFEIKG